MKRVLIVLVFSLLSFSSFSQDIKLSAYEEKALALFEKQEVGLWQPPNAAPGYRYIAVNGRVFQMTPQDFVIVIINSFRRCEDMDAYTNRRDATESCEAYVYSGFKEWIAMSKDKTISQKAWHMGSNYGWHTGGYLASNSSFDFNGWVAGIRVAKSKGY